MARAQRTKLAPGLKAEVDAPCAGAAWPIQPCARMRQNGEPLTYSTPWGNGQAEAHYPQKIGKKSGKICWARIIPNMPRAKRSKTFSVDHGIDKKQLLFLLFDVLFLSAASLFVHGFISAALHNCVTAARFISASALPCRSRQARERARDATLSVTPDSPSAPELWLVLGGTGRHGRHTRHTRHARHRGTRPQTGDTM